MGGRGCTLGLGWAIWKWQFTQAALDCWGTKSTRKEFQREDWIILKCIILIEVIYSQEKKLHVFSDMWVLANNVWMWVCAVQRNVRVGTVCNRKKRTKRLNTRGWRTKCRWWTQGMKEDKKPFSSYYSVKKFQVLMEDKDIKHDYESVNLMWSLIPSILNAISNYKSLLSCKDFESG